MSFHSILQRSFALSRALVITSTYLEQALILPSTFKRPLNTYSTPSRRMASTKSLPTSMVAQQVTGAGPMETKFRFNQTAPVPKLKPNQTLIKVLSASPNPVDFKMSEIPLLSKFIVGYPHTPGMDFVGRVWATTLPESAGFRGGDLVFGSHPPPATLGAMAEFTIMTGSDYLMKCPPNVEIDELATVGVAALTAYQCIEPFLGPDPQGKSVFINGGSGGTGTFGIQLAKHVFGCKVVTSCSAANANLCESLGADHVIDYRSQNVVEELKKWVAENNGGQKFDLVVDNSGADLSIYFKSDQYLKEGAPYNQVGGDMSLGFIKGMMAIYLLPGFLGGGKRKFSFIGVVGKKEQWNRIAQWMSEGKIKAVIDETFEFKDADKCYKKLKNGRTRGKLVVRVSEDGRGSS